MTDNEIIKAWQKILSMGDAPIGEHWSVGGVVTTKLAKETFDMLNRLKTLNDKNENTIRLAAKTIKTQGAEIEKLKSDNDILVKNIHNLCKELDAEKLKNF